MLPGVVAHHAHARVCGDDVVGVEVPGNQAGVGLVAVLCLHLEVARLRALGTVAAGVGVADDLDQTAFGSHGFEGARALGGERVKGRAAKLALCHLLQAQHVLALAQAFGQRHVVWFLTREVELAKELAVDEHLMVALTLLAHPDTDGRAREGGLYIGAHPVVTDGTVGQSLHTPCEADACIRGTYGAVGMRGQRQQAQ